MNRINVYIDWFRKDCTKQFIKFVKRKIPNYDLIRLSFLSLFYNEFLTRSYAIDTFLEPLFWFVDNFTDTLGPIFVFLVLLLLFLYVTIAYIVGLPFYLVKSVPISILALILGNYLLINALFHYFMALTTDPGCLPSNVFIKNSVSICKKCILPKPPRTHHCSVCDKCILSMDHHCPWLNNCIGHFNHRYFFMFSVFSWLGTIFVIIFGIPIALNHFFNIDIFDRDFQMSSLFNSNSYLNVSTTKPDQSIVEVNEHMQKEYFNFIKMNYQNVKNNCILFEILLTGSAFVAIGGLMIWHGKMIANGETCIESLRNKKERLRLNGDERFVNPFDKGWKSNWKRFFGLDQKGIGWTSVFFPSTHRPTGDGINWDVYLN